MKSVRKKKHGLTAKRNLFAELSEGVKALADERLGKRTLRTHAVVRTPAPEVTPAELVRVKKASESLSSLICRLLSTMFARWRIGNRGAPGQTLRLRCLSDS